MTAAEAERRIRAWAAWRNGPFPDTAIRFLLAELARKDEALRDIAEYEPTAEVVYDEFAYARMCAGYKDAARAALGERDG